MLPCLPSNEVEIPLQNKVETKESRDSTTKQSGDPLQHKVGRRDSTPKQSGDPLQNKTKWRSTTKQSGDPLQNKMEILLQHKVESS